MDHRSNQIKISKIQTSWISNFFFTSILEIGTVFQSMDRTVWSASGKDAVICFERHRSSKVILTLKDIITYS